MKKIDILGRRSKVKVVGTSLARFAGLKLTVLQIDSAGLFCGGAAS
jgi:hypothetical protein